jgi:hypothetical protein
MLPGKPAHHTMARARDNKLGVKNTSMLAAVEAWSSATREEMKTWNTWLEIRKTHVAD